MTIQTVTSNSLPHEAQPPAGLPDVNALANLANQIFSALPGREAGAGLQPAAGGERATTVLPQTATPALEPALATDGLEAQRLSGWQQGAERQAFLAPPTLPQPRDPAATAGFYFLSENQARQKRFSPDTVLDGLANQALTGQAHLSDQPFAGAVNGGLESVIGSLFPAVAAPVSGVAQEATSGQYYFLEQGQPRREAAPQQRPRSSFDVHAVRRDFPILAERVNGKPLVWLDNAATTHKPQVVIDRLAYFYAHENSNIHRAAHELAARATDAYEGARNSVARFLGAKSPTEIIFTRGATEAINLIANTFGRQHIGEGDEIVVSQLEHHANIVPWQQLAASVGAKIRVIPVDDSGQILLDEYRKLLSPRTRLVSITQVSNALGTVTPVEQVIALAHQAGARVLVDGAQAVSHLKVNVQALDADFYVFSGHKVFGPTGIGAVYGKAELLETLPPWQGGGNMIADVTFEKTLYQPAPARFEAGTGNIADAVGLGAALDYVERLGLDNINRYEHELLEYATGQLIRIPGLRLIGTAANKASVLSFVLSGYRTEEVGNALNREGIAVRSGHHCAQPILRRFGVEATVRPSLAFYNTYEEVDLLAATLHKLAKGR
ncbi:family 2A encapsulin nanocompartment cargo protein cysteine desulfurase [Serratia plymuthica]|uniref:cysteine desulfurase n=1 Tax=Serratia plymuthica TaxID=82996 RepID=A0A2X4V0E6_SERPL|nr:family 2A encapsulin nanocompartment cargo protein cysteine desulfurase [Serratia plymuthica]QPS20789.1 cysteine desulfurase [Serratia plymuthica]QPS62402.1 cysteine desulfurase [Serratia plymuthica]RKS65307.1 cysteine desulfurase/selenocysteine lyase [Serratia plymuthica]CAI2435040.1 Cysteine desulfurase [Serratia plymuthica]SQI40332.1 Cysteine desulfurase [Serratia plymuthica]